MDDVAQWLSTLGLGQYDSNFRQQAIDGTELLALTASDLEMSVGVCEWKWVISFVCVCGGGGGCVGVSLPVGVFGCECVELCLG